MLVQLRVPTLSAQLGRIAAYLARLQLVGILEGARFGGAVHAHRATDVRVVWRVRDTEEPTETVEVEAMARLPDGGSDADWDRLLLVALADRLGHELGEALQRDGIPVADPHARPRVWPWRATDRSES